MKLNKNTLECVKYGLLSLAVIIGISICKIIGGLDSKDVIEIILNAIMLFIIDFIFLKFTVFNNKK